MSYAIADLVSGSPDYAGEAASREAQRVSNISQGGRAINKAFAGFNDDFYKKRAQAYENYALPQVAQQYQTNKNQMGFGLANRGLLGGTAATNQFSLLNRTNAQAQQSIADQGVSQANALRQQVEQQKNQLLTNLYQSADPAQAGASAIATAAGFQTPSTFSAVANQFSGIADQYYLSQLMNNYKPTSYVNAPNTSDTGFSASNLSVSGDR
jgi:hypothetical protein